MPINTICIHMYVCVVHAEVQHYDKTFCINVELPKLQLELFNVDVVN